MLTAIALVAFTFQKLGPVLPPSCSSAFQTSVLAVEELLQNSKFEEASKLTRRLPKTSIGFAWDESKIPPTFRAEFRRARDEAFAMWKSRVPNLRIEASSTPDIRFSFEPVLALRPETGMPASHVGFFSDDASQARLDFVVGLKRGRPIQVSEVTDVFDDVAYALGMYFGVADGIFETYVMAPTDLPRTSRTKISGTELATVRLNLSAIAELKQAVVTRTPMTVSKSELFLESSVLKAPPALQGERVELNIVASNHGTGPLAFSMFPDCGCTIVTEPGTIDPESTRQLKLVVDTAMFTTDIEKHVTLYTNDPTAPVRVVTLKVPVKPRYRLISPEGFTVVVPKVGKKMAIYLVPTRSGDIEPISYKFDGDGMGASVTMHPFKGMLADPELHEGPKLRSGYKYTITFSGKMQPGRVFGTLQIYTPNPDFPNITCTMYAQQGIIALPQSVFMGEVGRVPRKVNFTVTGPGTGFKILSTETNSPNLTATFAQVPGTEDYYVTVGYDGKGKPGELIADVRVKTTNPKQPLIHVPVRAILQ